MILASRIAIMRGGVVQQFALPEEICERPANMYVAGFIGSPR
jgi:multiple sugar transport system ATP-binding protein